MSETQIQNSFRWKKLRHSQDAEQDDTTVGDTGYEEGYNSGYQEGLKKASEEQAVLLERLSLAVNRLGEEQLELERSVVMGSIDFVRNMFLELLDLELSTNQKMLQIVEAKLLEQVVEQPATIKLSPDLAWLLQANCLTHAAEVDENLEPSTMRCESPCALREINVKRNFEQAFAAVPTSEDAIAEPAE